MGRFQLESIYLYFLAGTTVENKGKLILIVLFNLNKPLCKSYSVPAITIWSQNLLLINIQIHLSKKIIFCSKIAYT
jgi:hypothetical protein